MGNSLLLNSKQILQFVEGAQLLFAAPAEAARRGFALVATDSRNVRTGALFVPLVGEVQDGHAFIEEASCAGAAAVFAEKTWAKKNAALLRGLYQKNGTLFLRLHRR